MVANSNCFGEGLEIVGGKLVIDLVGTGAVNYNDGVIDVCVGDGLQLVSDANGNVCIELVEVEEEVECNTCVAYDSATTNWVNPQVTVDGGESRCQGGIDNAIEVCNPADACGPMVVQLTKQGQGIFASSSSANQSFVVYTKCRGGVGATVATLNTGTGSAANWPWIDGQMVGTSIGSGPDQMIWTNPDIVEFVTLQPGECYARQMQVCIDVLDGSQILYRRAFTQQSAYGVSVPAC